MATLSLQHRTLARPAEVAGPGLFCPQRGRVAIHPAPAGTGLRFLRIDAGARQPGSQAAPAFIPALASHVRARPRQTVLSLPAEASGGTKPPSVQTVEHLLSALVGVGCTDATIEVDGPEVPLADGSSAPFVEAILAAGVVASPDAASVPALSPIEVTAPIEVAEGEARIVALPASGPYLDVTYDLDYGPGAPLQPQSGYYRHDYASPDARAYARDIAPARTFATLAEAEQLRAAGLFAHLSPGDVVVLGPDGPIGTALRFRNEPARHKVLDVLGDLALAGRPIFARINAARSGHALNHRLAQILAGL